MNHLRNLAHILAGYYDLATEGFHNRSLPPVTWKQYDRKYIPPLTKCHDTVLVFGGQGRYVRDASWRTFLQIVRVEDLTGRTN